MVQNPYWGRRFGSIIHGERCFPQKKWGQNYGGNSNRKVEHYTRTLARNAMALGWLNGVRRGKGHAHQKQEVSTA